MDTLLVNDAEASWSLGISRSKFHELVAQGRIPRLKMGRSARYRPADLLAYIHDLAAQAEANARGTPPTAIRGRTERSESTMLE